LSYGRTDRAPERSVGSERGADGGHPGMQNDRIVENAREF